MIKRKFIESKQRILEVIKLDTTPDKIARGVAIAIFINFLPSLGLGVFFVAIIARIIKGSMVAALSFQVATAIFIPLFYTLNVMTGGLITGSAEFLTRFKENLSLLYNQLLARLDSYLGDGIISIILQELKQFSIDFLIGSVVNAVLAAAFLYLFFNFILVRKNKNR